MGGLIGEANNTKNGLVSKTLAPTSTYNIHPYVLIFKTSNTSGIFRMLIANGNVSGDILYYIAVNIDTKTVKVQRLFGSNDFRILYRQTPEFFEMYIAGRNSSENMGSAQLSRTMLLNTTGELSNLEPISEGYIDESQFTIMNIPQ